MKTAYEILEKLAYPGRGIILGISPNGENLMIAYFLMGRSSNSKNRILVFKKNKISAEPFKSNIKNPSLVIYDPIVKFKQFVIVSNGNQTETILEGLKANKSFYESLKTRNFENDPPIFTPRISAIVKINKHNKTCSYKMAIIKSGTRPTSTQRAFFEFDWPIPGQAHFIHTYFGKGQNETKSFNRAPRLVSLPDDLNSFACKIWHALNEKNKVSLFVESISLSSLSCSRKIFNINH